MKRKGMVPSCFAWLLKNITSLVESAGIPYWLDGGALLGLVRSGALIPHDYDLDIGVFVESQPQIEALRQAFIDLGHAPGKMTSRYLKVSLHSGNPIFCDICFWYPEADQQNLSFNFNRGKVRFPKFFFENLDSIDFEGIKLPIPRAVETYLEYSYGPNWRTPIKSFWTAETKEARNARFITMRPRFQEIDPTYI